jgi:hypothetical protein
LRLSRDALLSFKGRTHKCLWLEKPGRDWAPAFAGVTKLFEAARFLRWRNLLEVTRFLEGNETFGGDEIFGDD